MRRYFKNCFVSQLFICLVVSCSTNVDEWTGYSRVDHIIVSRLPLDSSKLEPSIDEQNNDSLVTTRATTTGTGQNIGILFEHTDTLGIFPDGGYQIPFVLPLKEGETASGVLIEAQGWMTKDGIMYSTYLPFNFYNRNYNRIPWDYGKPQIQSVNTNHEHLGEHIFEATDTTRADNGTFHASLRNMACILRFQCYAPTNADYRKVVLAIDYNGFPQKGYFDLFDVHKNANGKHTPESQPFIAENNTNFVYVLIKSAPLATKNVLTAYLVVPPIDLRGKTITAYVWDSNGNCYSQTMTLDNSDSRNWERGTVRGIAFTGLALTTTPSAYVTPYDSEVGLGGVALE